MNGFLGDGPTFGSTAARQNSLELPAALLPVHGHQRQDEVGLVELDAFGVDPNERSRDLLLIGARSQLDDLEPEVAKITDPVDPLLEQVLPQRYGSSTPRLSDTRCKN